jgi:probable phosphoglycerate mutase
MLFFYVRHGDPIYDPDSLTPLGERQAEAIAKRLALYGIDEIYSSTSERARLTAKPTCEILKKEAKLLDFAHEGHAWRELTVQRDDGKGTTWLFQYNKYIDLLNSKEMRDLGDRWYEHPAFAQYDFKKGMERIYDNSDAFFASLGYEHIRYSGKYKVLSHSNKRIALFAHQGFGLAFLSALLDIPYPMLSTHFDICHTGMTVIEFADNGGFSVPKVLTLSSDSHLYRDGLPTKYNNSLYF